MHSIKRSLPNSPTGHGRTIEFGVVRPAVYSAYSDFARYSLIACTNSSCATCDGLQFSEMKRVFVSGASGNVGSEVVRSLLTKDVDIVALGRTAAGCEKVLGSHPRLSFRDLDLTNPESSVKAVSDCSSERPFSLFLLRPPEQSNPKVTCSLIDASIGKGLQHVVFLSVYGVEKNPAIPHAKIEAYIKSQSEQHGFSYTMLRPSFFMQNLTGPNHAPDIREKDIIDVPAGHGRTSFIHTRDIGEVAAACLAHPQAHAGKAYMLTGREALTYEEVAALLTKALGRKITYYNSTSLGFAWRQSSRGTPAGFIAVMTAIYATCWLGLAEGVSEECERLLGRKPITVAEWAEEETTKKALAKASA